MLHKLLALISATCLFIAFAGLAGAADLDMLTMQSLQSAGILALIGTAAGIGAYTEAGLRRKKTKTPQARHTCRKAS